MLTLGDLMVVLLLLAASALFWHSRALREHVLELVRQACQREEVLLLDDCVAFRSLRLLRDGCGHRRLAREFCFEFTVTGEQRHTGRVLMYGRQLWKLELDPHPTRVPTLRDERVEQVVYLDEWRRRHRQQSSHV